MMTGKITKLMRFPAKGQPGEEVGKAMCLAHLGMEGDRFAKGGETQMTAVDAAAAEWVRTHPDSGLCYKKFKANIEIEGLDFSCLQPGETVTCGEAVLEISGQGKECFPQCELLQQKKLCPLKQGVIYLKVLQSGEITTNCPIIIS